MTEVCALNWKLHHLSFPGDSKENKKEERGKEGGGGREAVWEHFEN